MLYEWKQTLKHQKVLLRSCQQCHIRSSVLLKYKINISHTHSPSTFTYLSNVLLQVEKIPHHSLQLLLLRRCRYCWRKRFLWGWLAWTNYSVARLQPAQVLDFLQDSKGKLHIVSVYRGSVFVLEAKGDQERNYIKSLSSYWGTFHGTLNSDLCQRNRITNENAHVTCLCIIAVVNMMNLCSFQLYMHKANCLKWPCKSKTAQVKDEKKNKKKRHITFQTTFPVLSVFNHIQASGVSGTEKSQKHTNVMLHFRDSSPIEMRTSNIQYLATNLLPRFP